MRGRPWHAPAMTVRIAVAMSAALVACKGRARRDEAQPVAAPVAPAAPAPVAPAAEVAPVAAPEPVAPDAAPVAGPGTADAASDAGAADEGPPCPGAADVVAIHGAGRNLALVVDDDDDPPTRHELLIERGSGQVVRHAALPVVAAPELPSLDFEDDDAGRDAADGVEVCPTDRPCLKLVPQHARDEHFAAVRLRDDGRAIGFVLADDDGGARVEVWDLVSGRRRGRFDLGELERSSDDELAIAFTGDAVVVLAIDDERARAVIGTLDGRHPRRIDGGARDLAPRSVVDLGGGRFAFVRIGAEGTEVVTESTGGRPPGRGPVLVDCGTDPALFDVGQGQVACVIDDDVDSVTITVVDTARGAARTTRVVCEDR